MWKIRVEEDTTPKFKVRGLKIFGQNGPEFK